MTPSTKVFVKNKLFRFCVLAGGSKGNAIFVESHAARILIDAGLTCRQLEKRLEAIGADPRAIQAIILTHEHRDHIQGVRVFTKKYPATVYANATAFDAIKPFIGDISRVQFFHSSEDFRIHDLILSPFPIPHDALDPVGLVISNHGKSLGIASDLGYVTHLVRQRLQGVHSLVVESNHDAEMLFSGPYPWALKQRVKGKNGHLSNDECRTLLEDIFSVSGLKSVILTHLSETNNCPNLVASSPGKFLQERGVTFDIASQNTVSRMMDVAPG